MARIEEVPLDLGTLQEMDSGRIAKVLAHHLSRASQDCMNRPSDTKAREVTVRFAFIPVPNPNTGEAEEAKCEIEIKSKVPVHRSKEFHMRMGVKGFRFNQDFEDDLNQPSLFPKKRDEEQGDQTK